MANDKRIDAEIALQTARLVCVEAQIKLLQRGMAFMVCPWCTRVTAHGETAECCKAMHGAIAAVLHREITEVSLENADRIAQKAVLN